MVVPIYVKFSEEKPFDVTVRQWREITRTAHRQIGLDWFKKSFARHFEPGAHERYHYSPRSAKYAAYKYKLFHLAGFAKIQGQIFPLSGQGQDLVLTGRFRDLLRATFDVRGFPTRTTIKAETPKYAPMHPRKLPDKVDEAFRLSPAELRENARRLGEYVREGIAAAPRKQTTVIGHAA